MGVKHRLVLYRRVNRRYGRSDASTIGAETNAAQQPAGAFGVLDFRKDGGKVG
jgi:hypothetical protein